MAGHGPPPKDPALRQRRNKTSTRAVVDATVAQPAEAQRRDLPIRPCSFCPKPIARPEKRKRKKGACRRRKAEPAPADICDVCRGTRILPWHRWTLEWWAAVWDPSRNPFCAQYLETEILGSLRVLANLYDEFFRDVDRGIVSLDVERAIRLRERALVLDPLARRAAQWEVKKPPVRPAAPPTPDGSGPAKPTVDPRKVLFMEAAGGNRA